LSRRPVKLYESSDESHEQISSEVGIRANTLVKWVHVHEKTGSGGLT